MHAETHATTAAHWFDRPRFYTETARVLAPGGSIALVQNERRWWDYEALAEYETIFEGLVPGYRRGSHPDATGMFSVADFATELSAAASFTAPTSRFLDWETRFDNEAFVDQSIVNHRATGHHTDINRHNSRGIGGIPRSARQERGDCRSISHKTGHSAARRCPRSLMRNLPRQNRQLPRRIMNVSMVLSAIDHHRTGIAQRHHGISHQELGVGTFDLQQHVTVRMGMTHR